MQALVLVLLYQVFLRGITGEKILKILYKGVEFPGKINTYFYGFDLGMTHDFIAAGIVGMFLLVSIYVDYKKHKYVLRKSDLAYFLLYPLATFFVLWLLPMVKSLFILTSMLFSVMIHQFGKILFQNKNKEENKK